MHHISLVEMIIFQNGFGNRTGIFSLTTVLSNTVPIYGYKNNAKKNTLGKTTQQTTDSSRSEKVKKLR